MRKVGGHMLVSVWTTLGSFLSHKLGWPLYEGDDFHPQQNVEKMSRGEPLTDQDRLPWLLKLHDVIQRELSSGCNAIVVCSALRRLYREILLFGSKALTSSELGGLTLCSIPGFEVLEPPAAGENSILLDIWRSTDDICREIEEHLHQLS
ncbi:hypothetical protein DPEC_G00264860 [Dallia pectoralis]|uniref:Uncharacterized protein n=1 Tax=Dallia pectoralis TaxID=75939 RepID=A0ACC2FSN6_DALPE|nr:hypothetical protein DPEC_G00264860 [Dallia pectoralis]